MRIFPTEQPEAEAVNSIHKLSDEGAFFRVINNNESDLEQDICPDIAAKIEEAHEGAITPIIIPWTDMRTVLLGHTEELQLGHESARFIFKTIADHLISNSGAVNENGQVDRERLTEYLDRQIPEGRKTLFSNTNEEIIRWYTGVPPMKIGKLKVSDGRSVEEVRRLTQYEYTGFKDYDMVVYNDIISNMCRPDAEGNPRPIAAIIPIPYDNAVPWGRVYSGLQYLARSIFDKYFAEFRKLYGYVPVNIVHVSDEDVDLEPMYNYMTKQKADAYVVLAK